MSRRPCILRRFPGSLRRGRTVQDQHLPLLLTAVAPHLWCRSRRRQPRQPLPLIPPSRVGSGRGTKVRHPFCLAPVVPVANVGVPGGSPPNRVSRPLRVGGCLSAHWRHWQAIGAESWVLSVLRNGYRIPFLDSPPPLACTPISFPPYQSGSPRSLVLGKEIEQMLIKDVMEIILDPDPSFYSSLFLVGKVTGGWRPVFDLSHLNGFVQQTPFKMETLASVLLSVRDGNFLASIDLKDAYFQIPVHQASRKLLRFLWGGVVYQFKALCMDCRLPLRSSPGCLQRSLRGLTHTKFVFSGTWMTGWSWPPWRPWSKRTFRICFRFVTPSG